MRAEYDMAAGAQGSSRDTSRSSLGYALVMAAPGSGSADAGTDRDGMLERKVPSRQRGDLVATRTGLTNRPRAPPAAHHPGVTRRLTNIEARISLASSDRFPIPTDDVSTAAEMVSDHLG